MARTHVACAWRHTAGYLYQLHLDGPALAWEFLRRNPEYQESYRLRRQRWRRELARPEHWGLMEWEDPGRNAREAFPIWKPELLPVLHISPASDAGGRPCPGLDLWNMPGRKHLRMLDIADGYLALVVQCGARWLRARIEPMALTAPSCIFWLPVPASATPALLQAQLLPSLPGILPDNRRRPRAYRNETLHLRALQALDGVAAGATQREIAQVIFGQERVQEDWHADSGLRRQIRHYLSRGNFFMREGYLDLLTLR